MLTLTCVVCCNFCPRPIGQFFCFRGGQNTCQDCWKSAELMVSFLLSWCQSEKTGPKTVQHGACLTEGSKAIWAMPKYTDHFSKRGFPNFDLLFIGKCNTVMLAIKKMRA